MSKLFNLFHVFNRLKINLEIKNIYLPPPNKLLEYSVDRRCQELVRGHIPIRLYWKRVIAQYRGLTVVFQICTMYTAFLDKEIFHQSPGRRSR